MKRPPRSPPGCACTHAPLGGRARLNPRQPRPVTTLRLDLYAWLTYRMSYLSKPVTVPWPSLMDQFGFQLAPGPKGAYQFRTTLKKALREVLCVYPDARAEATNKGLLLKPSRTSVPFRGLRELAQGGQATG